MKLRDYIRADVQTRENESVVKIYAKILLIPEYNAVYLIRKAQFARNALMKQHYRNLLVRKYGIFLGKNTQIGPGLKIGHPTSIVIGDGVQIGKNCTLYQQTTIGLKNVDADAYPCVGDDVVIYAGAKIIGPVQIGNRSAIGANAVVTKSCDADCVMKGVPARCTSKKSCS